MQTKRSGGALVAALLILLGLIAVAGCGLGGCAWQGYNKAVRLDESTKTAWAQVENVLQRRYDLIPNLVETVKGVAGQEQEIFLGIAQSREKYFSAGSRGEKIEAAAGIERALSRLLVLQERYPELRSQEAFQGLMAELAGSENRIAVERKRYNEAVRAVNTFRRGLLSSFWASWAGVDEAKLFEAEEAAGDAPKVDFGGIRGGGAASSPSDTEDSGGETDQDGDD